MSGACISLRVNNNLLALVAMSLLRIFGFSWGWGAFVSPQENFEGLGTEKG